MSLSPPLNHTFKVTSIKMYRVFYHSQVGLAKFSQHEVHTFIIFVRNIKSIVECCTLSGLRNSLVILCAQHS